MEDRDLAKAAAAEFLGAFTWVVAGAGAVIATQHLGDGGSLVAIALATGIAVALVVAVFGGISGGYFNPAVSIALLATGSLAPARAGAYIVAQVLGAIAGAGVLTLIFPALGELGRNNLGVNLGVPLLGPDITVAGGVLLEAVLTFFLVLAIFGTIVDARGSKVIAPLVIGLTITMGILVGERVTGAAMNPARALGPEVVQQDFANFWIYWIGPVIGAVAAAFLYTFVWLAPTAPAAPAKRTVAASPPPEPRPLPPEEPKRRRRRR